jgi:hypothetical protein
VTATPHDGPDPQEADAPSVRPYMVTGGRTRPAGEDLPIEALVERVTRLPQPTGRASLAGPESRRILELTEGRYLSVAEISAHAHLPVGVVRVLVSDLAEAGAVRIHGLTPAALTDPSSDNAAALAVLESVLDGISAL